MEDFRKFLKKHPLAFKIVFVGLNTIIIFYINYFNDRRPASFETIKAHIDDPLMYARLLITFLGSLFTIHFIMKFNAKREKNSLKT